VRIDISDEARRQLEEADEWWGRNRNDPDVFYAEFDQARSHLRSAPNSGREYGYRRGRLIRRWLMPRSRYHVYYWYNEATHVLEIRAIWSAARGHGPPL
jgi:hypothetical protein